MEESKGIYQRLKEGALHIDYNEMSREFSDLFFKRASSPSRVILRCGEKGMRMFRTEVKNQSLINRLKKRYNFKRKI